MALVLPHDLAGGDDTPWAAKDAAEVRRRRGLLGHQFAMEAHRQHVLALAAELGIFAVAGVAGDEVVAAGRAGWNAVGFAPVGGAAFDPLATVGGDGDGFDAARVGGGEGG